MTQPSAASILLSLIFIISNGVAAPLSNSLVLEFETSEAGRTNEVESGIGPRMKKALKGPTVLLAPASGYSLTAFLLEDGLGSLRDSEANRTCHLAMDALRCGADSTEALVLHNKPQSLLDKIRDVSVMALHDVTEEAPEDASWILVMERQAAEDLFKGVEDSNIEVYKNVTGIVEWLEKNSHHVHDWTTIPDSTIISMEENLL